ncbi:MAG TPA: hypothetical protein VN200_05335 [Rhodoglobus sp.]|nr:hypothetical protein [Rhodoglobus sp.]
MTQPATLIDRVALAALVPSLVLPVAASVAAVAGGLAYEESSGDAVGIEPIIVVVYMFVLLGSMTLNSWLLLRHPDTLGDRALPRRLTVLTLALDALILMWTILMAAGVLGWTGLVFGIVIAALSVVVFVPAVARFLRRPDARPLAAPTLPAWARIVAALYLALAVLALLAAVAEPFIPGSPLQANGAIGGVSTWALLLLGLPWSHPLYASSLVVSLSLQVPLTGIATAPAVLANAVLVTLLLVSAHHRERIGTWFFRLRPGTTTAAPPLGAPPPV